MAYSCVKVLFEIGHEASLRNKQTPEGFTHDWVVFVRGADNSDIFHFVEKVVFHLHETFPKPKRVVKDPPYVVKESGYAGFTLPIDIYFKNSDEPKKVRFNYDLHLQQAGPPISKVLREQCVFPNPAEDLRRRLIKGGGVGVLGSESSFHSVSSEKLPASGDESHTHKHSTTTLVGKPKLSSSDPNKKHKVKDGKGDESRVSNSFHDLFGPPIKTAKVSPDPKKSSHSSPKVSPVSKPLKPVDKSSSDKSEKSSKSSKHGSQKEGKESSDRSSSGSSSVSKEEKKDKEKNKEKDKNKDKSSKRPSTPVKPPSTPPKRPSTPPKRPPSPPKRPSSPAKLLAPPPPAKLASSPKHLSASKPNKDEIKKASSEDNKTKGESKSSENNKSEKKKKDKKNREEKPKKDKHKDHEKGNEKANKSEKNKETKEKDSSKKTDKEVAKEPEKIKEKEKEKSKHTDGDKEKQRHKHKKKDKSNKDKDREKERDKDKSSKKSSENKITNEIRDKDKNGLSNESTRNNTDISSDLAASHKKQTSSPSPSPVRAVASPVKPSSTPEKLVSNASNKDKHKRPLLLSDDSSDSNSSASSVDEEIEPSVSRVKSIKTPESGFLPVESKSSVLPVTEPPRPNSRTEIVKPKSDNSSQERNSLNKSSSKQKEKSSKKNKERESGCGDGDKSEKNSKKSKRKRSSKIIDEVDCSQNNGEAPTKVPKLELESEDPPVEAEQLEEKPSLDDMEIKEESEQEESPAPAPPPPLPPPTMPASHLTEEYVSQLRELQHKIMTLEDNAELQRVVQVIAETGQYEITKKTFDFDLCALDRSTVKRLQEFFAPS